MFGIKESKTNPKKYRNEAYMIKEVIVKEAMKTNIIKIQPDNTVLEAAIKMKKHKIGNVIVVEQKQPIGILTESDILKKVVAEGKHADTTLVEDVMSTPIIVGDPYISLEKAMTIMGKCNIRRLPVIENGELIGVITQRDISRISPVLLEISKEWSDITIQDDSSTADQVFSGKCEDCTTLSYNLKKKEGRLLCESCIDSLQYE